MLTSKFLLYFVIGTCSLSLVLSAAASTMTYDEPDMEASSILPAEDGQTEASDDGGDGMMSKINDVVDEEGSSSSEEGSSSCSTESSTGELLELLTSFTAGTDSSSDCQLTATLVSMAEFLRILSEDVKELKSQVASSCSGGGAAGDSDESSEEQEDEQDGSSDEYDEEEESSSGEEGQEDSEGSGTDEGSGDDVKEEEEAEEAEEEDVTTMATPTTTLPPPPTSCPAPFQLLAQSCYYIQTDPREWRSWGDAHAFCQQQDGSLAAPYRAQDLRDYLQQSYSSVFWVGGRLAEEDWVWLNGQLMTEDDWKRGKPSNHTARRCVYLDYWNSYRGVNHFCGEKFSFVCEHSGM